MVVNLEGTLVSGNYFAVLALGVQNAFNFATWTRIKDSFPDIDILGNLAYLVGKYLSVNSGTAEQF